MALEFDLGKKIMIENRTVFGLLQFFGELGGLYDFAFYFIAFLIGRV